MESKTCTVCKIEKPVGEFHKDPTRRFGVSHRCKVCHCAESLRRHHEKMKDPSWKKIKAKQSYTAHCKRRYKITAEVYEMLKERSKDLCECCGQAPRGNRGLNVDHCHTTGKVRGLLCNRCNVQLAILENPSLLEKAAAYLRKHQNETK